MTTDPQSMPVESVLAAQACAHCPIKAACYAYGIKHVTEAGIYGGHGPKQRKAFAQLATKDRSNV